MAPWSFPWRSSFSACLRAASRSTAMSVPSWCRPLHTHRPGIALDARGRWSCSIGYGSLVLIRLIDRIKQAAPRLERAAVKRRIAVPGDGGQVIGGRVALVSVVTVAWIGGVMGEHLAVARHLRHDGGGGDRGA